MKTCHTCNTEKPETAFYASPATKDGLQCCCKKCLNTRSVCWGKQYKERRNAMVKKCCRRARAEALEAYGNCCNCCGEDKEVFLAIDHVANDGAEHRKKETAGHGGCNLYLWLRRNGYPEGFQVLCHNCNWAKAHGGCPHQEKQ